MQIIEISKAFYNEYGMPMINSDFADVKDRIAVGLCGEGSECLGYDDEISYDHDVDAGFCLFITREDDEKFGHRLSRAYAHLPKEYKGFQRQRLSPVGGNRRGVIIIEDFYTRFLGAENAPDSIERWLYTPSQSLLCASNGEVFEDKLGIFSETREILKKGYPEDIRLKKLAAHIVMMAQSGQYNYERLIKRGELGAAQLATYEFVKHTISAVYLLNNKYEPYYKWAYRGMRELAVLSELEPLLEGLSELHNSEKTAITKCEITEGISQAVINELKAQNITKATCGSLEKHAYSVTDFIKDANIRNMHIMSGI